MSQEFPPMRGIFDMSKIGAAVTVMTPTGIYILIAIRYAPTIGREYTELVFTPYFNGILQTDPTNVTNFESFLGMMALNSDGEYVVPPVVAKKVVFNVERGGRDINNIRSVIAVAVRMSGKNLVAYLDGNTGTPYNILFTDAQDGTDTMATIDPLNPALTGTDVTLKATQGDSYYDQNPNFFAGMPYTLDYSDNTNKVFPFRFLDVLNDEPKSSVYKQPSTCVKGGGTGLILNPPYLCNLLTGDIDRSNLLFYLKMYIGEDVKAGLDDRAVLISSSNATPSDIPLFFLPTNFYQANFTVSGGKVFAPSIPCVPSTNLAQVLNNVYYFWASGFTQYSNEPDLSKFNPMIVAAAPGFIGKGPTQPVSVTSWTNLSDCQRSYYYNYCDPNSSCGTCFGGCTTAVLPCTANNKFTPTNVINVNPFTCSGNLDPINFWDKWKYWIIATAIVLGIFMVGVIIIVVLIGGKKAKPVDNSSQNDSTIVYR